VTLEEKVAKKHELQVYLTSQAVQDEKILIFTGVVSVAELTYIVKRCR